MNQQKIKQVFIETLGRRQLGISLLIVLAGVGLRVYHFSDWLIFKSDQARDAIFMQKVINGAETLPLLGPQIGGTELRLGPIFYYFQYLSGWLFGVSPETFALPDLCFGIATLFVLSLLFRKLFNPGIATWLLALASTSLFLVTFSRFGWNPNSLPFFTGLFLYFLLQALENTEKKRRLFLCGAAISFGIVAQLHLIAVLGLLVGLFPYVLIKKLLTWKELVMATVIVVLLHVPMIVHEWQTDGANIRSVITSTEKKMKSEEGHSGVEKIFRAYQEGASIVWLVSTGQQNTENISLKKGDFTCDKKCEESMGYSLIALIFFGIIGWTSYRSSIRLPEKERSVRTIILFWSGGFFLITIMLAYQVQVRFYLGVVVPIYCLLGFAAEYVLILCQRRRFFRGLVWSLLWVGVLLNTTATVDFLGGLKSSQVSAEESSKDLRFGTETKVTLGQLRAIAQDAGARLSNDTPVIISGESQHVKALYYVMSREGGFKGCYVKGRASEVTADYNQLILEESADVRNQGDKEMRSFGTLSSYVIKGRGASRDEKISVDGCLDY